MINKKVEQIYVSTSSNFSNSFDIKTTQIKVKTSDVNSTSNTTRFARSGEDSLREPNDIDNDPRFVLKHRDPISEAPKIFQDPIGLLSMIYPNAWDPI